jgi:deoxyribodipyrimidine photo-lyase
MINSLSDLASDIHDSGGKLYTLYGENVKIIKECIKAFNIDVIGFNIDYSPYALKRDEYIGTEIDIPLLLTHDYYLHQPGTILTKDGKPYQKFTPYFNNAMKRNMNQFMNQPLDVKKIKFTMKLMIAHEITLYAALKQFTSTDRQEHLVIKGGRQNALKILRQTIELTDHNELGKQTTDHNELGKQTTDHNELGKQTTDHNELGNQLQIIII